MEIAVALVLTLVSACALDAGYLVEHSVAARLEPLELGRPLHSLRLLLGNRRWLAGFSVEVTGWILYVAALALAPLSLVQATAAGGIGILAIMVARVTRTPLDVREQAGVLLSIAGLALLGASLAGAHGQGSDGSTHTIALWLAASGVAALVAIRYGSRLLGGGAAFGLATGILFSAGDVATKTTVSSHGTGRYPFVIALVAAYGLGTTVLQAGFQRGGALTTAGIATLLTNALPIAAGMTLFDEPLPDGWLGVVRVAAFATVVAGAVVLARGGKELGREQPQPRPASA